jgi:hypothetical protein
VRIELLYFAGCPNHEALERSLRELLGDTAFSARVELVEVRDPADAERRRFLGSPTLRVDGRDVEPGADGRSDFGLKCRLYRSDGALAGTPPQEWVRAALASTGTA